MAIPMRLLGRTGLRVSQLCLGTMTFGTEWGWGTDEAESRRIYDAYRQAGGNFVDTANNYNDGSSERMLGRFIAGERDHIVLASKFTFTGDATNPNSSGSTRKSLRINVEESLRRLGTDHLDLLWVHAWDRCTPTEETLRALDDLVRAGTVLAIGVSNTPAWAIARGNAIAELRGWTQFCALQVQYSLAERSIERELLPMARATGLATLAWSPLGRGLLLGKLDDDKLTPRQRVIVETVAEISRETSATRAQVALAWVMAQDVMPVLGARSVDQITDNLGVLDVTLDESQLARLDAVARIELGYPLDWLDAPHRRAQFAPEEFGA